MTQALAPVRDCMRRNAMADPMAGQESDIFAIDRADHDPIGRFAVRRLYGLRLGVLEKLVKPGPAKDSDHTQPPLGHLAGDARRLRSRLGAESYGCRRAGRIRTGDLLLPKQAR